jgi:ribosomal protein S18 acetylase RimI-like enzyme
MGLTRNLSFRYRKEKSAFYVNKNFGNTLRWLKLICSKRPLSQGSFLWRINMIVFAQLNNAEESMELTVSEGQAVVYNFEVKDGGQVVGSAQLYIMTDERHPVPVGNVQNVWTHENYRRQGISRRIMTQLHETARRAGCSEIVLTSNPTRVAARNLYESMGYRMVTDGFKLKLID